MYNKIILMLLSGVSTFIIIPQKQDVKLHDNAIRMIHQDPAIEMGDINAVLDILDTKQHIVNIDPSVELVDVETLLTVLKKQNRSLYNSY